MSFEQKIYRKCINFFPTGFDTFAEIINLPTGTSRLIYGGIGYGKKCENKNGITWQCTKTRENTRNHRCLATVHTRIINGYEMVRVCNPKHSCVEFKDGYAKPKNKETSKKSKKL